MPTAKTGAVGARSAASSGGHCHAVSLDIAPGVRGAKTPVEAIAVFLGSGTATFALPRTGWHGPTVGGRFSSGPASMSVFHIGGAGFVVDAASDC
jgi:hypothetical protein